MALSKELLDELSKPFDEAVLGWKPIYVPKDPQTGQPGDKALCAVYVPVGEVIQRLNEVVGGDWNFDLKFVNGAHSCKGTLVIGGTARSNVGSAQEDEDKNAASDTLKRCARFFGVGLYFKDIPQRLFVEAGHPQEFNGAVARFADGSTSTRDVPDSSLVALRKHLLELAAQLGIS